MTIEYEIGDSVLSEKEYEEYEARIRTIAPGTELVGLTVLPDGVMFCCFRYSVTGTHRGLDPINFRGTSDAYESNALKNNYPYQYWGATPPSVGTDRTFVARSDDMGENWYIVQDLGYTHKATMDGVQIGYFLPSQIHRRKFRVRGDQDWNHSWGEEINATPDELVAVYPNPNDFMTGATLEEFLAFNPTMRGAKTLDPSEPTSPWEVRDVEDSPLDRSMPVPHQEEDGEYYYIVGTSFVTGRFLRGPWYATNTYQVYDVEDQWVSNEGIVNYSDPQIIYNYEDKNQSAVITSRSTSLMHGSNTIRTVRNLNRQDTDTGFLPGLVTPIKVGAAGIDKDGNAFYAGIGIKHEPGTLLTQYHCVYSSKERVDSNGNKYWDTQLWQIPHWYHFVSYDGIFNKGHPTYWGGTVGVKRPQGLFVMFRTFWTDGVRTGLRYYDNLIHPGFAWVEGGGFAPENTQTGYVPKLTERSTFELGESESIKDLALGGYSMFSKIVVALYVDALGNVNAGVAGSRETKNYGRPGTRQIRQINIGYSPISPANSQRPGQLHIPVDSRGKYPLRIYAQSTGQAGFMEVFDPNLIDGFHKQADDESIYEYPPQEGMQERPTLRKATYW